MNIEMNMGGGAPDGSGTRWGQVGKMAAGTRWGQGVARWEKGHVGVGQTGMGPDGGQ